MKTIIKINIFRRYDTSKIKSQLDKMAKKGYVLKRIHTIFWIYKKSNNVNITYDIVHSYRNFTDNPVASNLPSNRQEFADLCLENGWDFIASFYSMEIYINTDEHPIPIETDNKLKFKAVNAIMRNHFKVEAVILAVITIRLLYVTTFDILILNQMNRFTDPAIMLAIAIFVPWIINIVIAFFKYSDWYKRNKDKEDDYTLVDFSLTGKSRILYIFYVGFFILTAYNVSLSTGGLDLLLHLAYLVSTTFLICLVVSIISYKFKLDHLISIILIALTIFTLVFTGNFHMLNTYKFISNITYDVIEKTSVPFTVDKILDGDELTYENYTYYKSIFGENSTISGDIGHSKVRVRVFQPTSSVFFNMCRDELLYDTINLFKQVNEPFWNANEVYKSEEKRYIVFYDDVILTVSVYNMTITKIAQKISEQILSIK